jgi:hypothetical protein
MSPLRILSARQPPPKEQTLVCFPQVPLERSSSSSTTPATRGHPTLSLSIRFFIVRLTTGTSSYLELSRGNFRGYRADGPNDPANGQRFDRQKVLIDPYGKSASVGRNYDRAAACKPGDNAATCMKSVLVDLLKRAKTQLCRLLTTSSIRGPSSCCITTMRSKATPQLIKISLGRQFPV